MEVSSSALEYLLIEAVPLAQRVAAEIGQDLESEHIYRVEKYGKQVGRGLAHLETLDRPRMTQTLDIIRFIGKELWTLLYKKPIDNLKTNHRDTYVLIDNNFEYCSRMSSAEGPERTAELAAPFLWYPAGIIRGFLESMGFKATVQFKLVQSPAASFIVLIEE